MMFYKDEKIRLTVTGNRDFSDYNKFCFYADNFIQQILTSSAITKNFKSNEIEIIVLEGMRLEDFTRQYAKEHNYHIMEVGLGNKDEIKQDYLSLKNLYGDKVKLEDYFDVARNYMIIKMVSFVLIFWNDRRNSTKMLYDMCHASDDVSSMLITYSKVGD